MSGVAIDRPTVLELLEAEARQTMADLLTMPVRGFDTAKAKADEQERLDILLDQWNELHNGQTQVRKP